MLGQPLIDQGQCGRSHRHHTFTTNHFNGLITYSSEGFLTRNLDSLNSDFSVALAPVLQMVQKNHRLCSTACQLEADSCPFDVSQGHCQADLPN